MRKIHCPECAHSMPAGEHRCPKCGEPMTADAIEAGKKRNRVINLVMVAIFVAIAAYIVWPDGDAQKAAKPPAAPVATAQTTSKANKTDENFVSKVTRYELNITSLADAPDYMFQRVVQTHAARYSEGSLTKEKFISYIEGAAGSYQGAINTLNDRIEFPKGLPDDVANMTRLMGTSAKRAWTARIEGLEYLKAYLERQNPEDLDKYKKRLEMAAQLIGNTAHCYEKALKKARAAQN